MAAQGFFQRSHYIRDTETAMSPSELESMLTGGHPNSLGRTVEVVGIVLAEPDRLEDLLSCYESEDSVVRLRVSNALKRVTKERPELVVPYLDRLLDDVSQLDQPSAQWTLAQVFREVRDRMEPTQQRKAVDLMKRNLTDSQDWIVLTQTSVTLADFAREDSALRDWLRPELDRLSSDSRKSVAGTARRVIRDHFEVQRSG